jgi:hypothetical protein
VERARGVLQMIADGSRDPYEGYREVYGIYVGTSGLAEELKPHFRLPDIEPDGTIHLNENLRRIVIASATDWLRQNPK